MRTLPVVVALLVAGTALAALAPAAEAAQACTWRNSWCPGDVCWWDRLEQEWDCIDVFHCVIDHCWYP